MYIERKQIIQWHILIVSPQKLRHFARYKRKHNGLNPTAILLELLFWLYIIVISVVKYF